MQSSVATPSPAGLVGIGEPPGARVGRMFAALNATNEALLHSSAPDELYQRVCDAAVHGGQFISATMLLAEPGSAWAAVAATTGTKRRHLESRISIDEALPEGRGLVGHAFRSGRPCISERFVDDPRTQPWHALARRKQVAAGAAVPLRRGPQVTGVLLFLSGEAGAFDEEVIGWLERMSANVSHALANFDREHERRRAEAELRESQARFRSLLEISSDWFWERDADFRLLRIEGCSAVGQALDRSAIVGKRLWEFPGVVLDSADFDFFRAVAGRRELFRDFEYAFRDGSGQLRYMSVSGEPAFDAAGAFIGYRGTSRDVTQRRRHDALIALEHAVTRSLAEADSSRNVLKAVMRVVCESEQWETAGYFRVEDAAGTTQLVIGWRTAGTDAAATEYYRQAADSVIAPGGPLSQVVLSGEPVWFADMQQANTTWRERVGRTGERATFSFPVRVDAKVIGVLAFASREIREPDPALLQTVRVIGDQVGQFLQRKQAEQVLRESEARFQHLATHDSLTGLPNRGMFSELLSRAIQTAARYQRRFALLFIDLDRFKHVNDTLGHAAGDALLQAMALRLQGCLRSSDVVARLGGDEFVALVQQPGDLDETAAVARKLLDAAAQPIPLASGECRVSSSIGIALYPADAGDEQLLMQKADHAMYLAKQDGRNNFRFHSQAAVADAVRD